MTAGELVREMDRIASMTRLLEGSLIRIGAVEARVLQLEEAFASEVSAISGVGRQHQWVARPEARTQRIDP